MVFPRRATRRAGGAASRPPRAMPPPRRTLERATARSHAPVARVRAATADRRVPRRPPHPRAQVVPGLLETTFAGSTDEDIAAVCEKVRAPPGARWDVTAKIRMRDEKLREVRTMLSRVAEQRRAARMSMPFRFDDVSSARVEKIRFGPRVEGQPSFSSAQAAAWRRAGRGQGDARAAGDRVPGPPADPLVSAGAGSSKHVDVVEAFGRTPLPRRASRIFAGRSSSSPGASSRATGRPGILAPSGGSSRAS